ncbi:hypothetical protein Ais01nite_12680 [Asanoa ishikariensis]|uniref:Uncharacterized protein n=1 Tax=Asanoa ishikariensis TaxID=137265 RepID=A0A1H3T029_9ACTN|nr:hypothetical protein [Asanoa ishikariensis]GIF63233.1 hypothetical protein Ais01nite_12680 [Asanoa ishikariensis]SDZ43161.1 hypothetical protein SAMN05421684_4959 [Asanoa ishikariensis]
MPRLVIERGRTVVLADVAAMVGAPGAAAAGLWFAAREAHGALVGQCDLTAAHIAAAIADLVA